MCNVTQWHRTVGHVCTGSIPRALYVSLAHYGTFEAFGRFVNRVTLSERIGAVANHLKTKGAFTLNESEHENKTCLWSLPLRSMNSTWHFLWRRVGYQNVQVVISFTYPWKLTLLREWSGSERRVAWGVAECLWMEVRSEETADVTRDTRDTPDGTRSRLVPVPTPDTFCSSGSNTPELEIM